MMENLNEHIFDLQERVTRLELQMKEQQEETKQLIEVWKSGATFFKIIKWAAGIIVAVAAVWGVITGTSNDIPMIGE